MEIEVTPQTRCTWVVTWINQDGVEEKAEVESKHVCETICDLLEYNKTPFTLSLKLTP